MVDLQQQVADAFRRSPHVANVASIVGTTGGSSGLNNGRLFVELKPRDQRPALQKVLADLRRDTARIPGISAYATPVQNLRIGGRSSRAEYQFVMQSLNRPQLYEWSQKMADAMGRDPHFADVNSDLQINATQATLDRRQGQGELARDLGGAAALHAVFRLRQPADLHHLRHRRQLLRGDGVHRQDQLDHCGACPTSAFAIPPASWCRSAPSRASSARRARSPSISWDSFPRSPSRSTCPPGGALGDAVARIEQLKSDLKVPPAITTDLRRQCQDLPGLARQPGHPSDRRGGDDLYRARASSTRATSIPSPSSRACRRPSSVRCWRCACSAWT